MNTTLKKLAEDILRSDTIEKEVVSTEALWAFYSQLLDQLGIDAGSKSATTIYGGIALSPVHAIDCLKDGVRTARFLKGVHAAIQHTFEQKPNDKIEVVYAGSGPLGTILVPLLPLFDTSRMQVTILDIHETSIRACQSIVMELGLSACVKAFAQCDATKYMHDKPIDLLITETMDKALTREPQVMISEHLSKQLSGNGILVPKSISVFTGIANITEQPMAYRSLREDRSTFDQSPKDFLFSIHKESTISEKGFESDVFSNSRSLTSEVCIYTEIETFCGFKLTAGDSFITDPISLITTNSLTSDYTLIYTSTPEPRWTVVQKNDTE